MLHVIMVNCFLVIEKNAEYQCYSCFGNFASELITLVTKMVVLGTHNIYFLAKWVSNVQYNCNELFFTS